MAIISPVDSTARITSYYGYREAPTSTASTDHKGIDYAIGEGSNVYAATAGTIKKVGYDNTNGNYIILDDGNGIQTTYKHLKSVLSKIGQTVKAGETIALVGSTGDSTGSHLHFETKVNGEYVNPLSLLQTDSNSDLQTNSLLNSLKKNWLYIIIALVVYNFLVK